MDDCLNKMFWNHINISSHIYALKSIFIPRSPSTPESRAGCQKLPSRNQH